MEATKAFPVEKVSRKKNRTKKKKKTAITKY
jgi:hypothetical protein